MKKTNKLMIKSIIFAVICIVCLGSAIYMKFPKYDKNKQYVKEYVAGEEGMKGHVDVSLFMDEPAYEIGADEEGYAVFKNPDTAFQQMKKDFALGIDAIKKEYRLLPLSRWNFEEYEEYGSQLSETENSEAVAQAKKLSGYLDIYENSFSN